MRRLLCLLVIFVAAVPICDARSQPAGQRFVSIAFHDVVDRAGRARERCRHGTTLLVQFFDWLKGTRLDRGVARRPGGRRARRATAARQGDPHHLR